MPQRRSQLYLGAIFLLTLGSVGIAVVLLTMQVRTIDDQLQDFSTQNAGAWATHFPESKLLLGTPTVTPQHSCYGTITEVLVPLLPEPDLDARTEQIVNLDDRVAIIGIQGDDWYYIRSVLGNYGWVYSDYIEPSTACNDIPTAPQES